MIDYTNYCQSHDSHKRNGLKAAQIAEDLG